MVQVIVLDDISLDLKIIHKKITEYDNDLKVLCFENSKHMFNEIKKNKENNFIFIIDVVLKNENGIEVAKEIQKTYKKAPIIFISAFLDTATEVYDVEHCYYVYKTQLDEKLPVALQRALDYLDESKQQLVLDLKDKKIFIPFDDIIYMERNKRTTHIHCGDKIYLTSLKLREIFDKLPSIFVHCHASYIVNLNYMQEFERTQFILKNGTAISISRSHLNDVNKAIHQFVVQQ